MQQSSHTPSTSSTPPNYNSMSSLSTYCTVLTWVTACPTSVPCTSSCALAQDAHDITKHPVMQQQSHILNLFNTTALQQHFKFGHLRFRSVDEKTAVLKISTRWEVRPRETRLQCHCCLQTLLTMVQAYHVKLIVLLASKLQAINWVCLE
jgi:hypothetical protein